VISADKMMNRAKGPVWHKKQKQQGIIPKGLRGLDREATWCTSHADGWVYGHGSFTVASHGKPVLGCFMWMPNSANEAKRLWFETAHLKGLIDYVVMDTKADDYALYRELQRQRKMMLITSCRKTKIKSEQRQRMHQVMQKPKHKHIYKERAYRVEPMQGLVKDIFDLDRCWMRGNKSNRWLFAAMGVTVQMHQLIAYQENRSTWNIKNEVLG
jgi:hypothetical protein